MCSNKIKVLDDEELVRFAHENKHDLPSGLRGHVEAFRTTPPPAGCLLLRGLPVGELPPTPPAPTTPSGKDQATELRLLTIAALLCEPVGYLPEHYGNAVQ